MYFDHLLDFYLIIFYESIRFPSIFSVLVSCFSSTLFIFFFSFLSNLGHIVVNILYVYLICEILRLQSNRVDTGQILSLNDLFSSVYLTFILIPSLYGTFMSGFRSVTQIL